MDSKLKRGARGKAPPPTPDDLRGRAQEGAIDPADLLLGDAALAMLPLRLQSYVVGMTAPDILALVEALHLLANEEPLLHRKSALLDQASAYLDIAQALDPASHD